MLRAIQQPNLNRAQVPIIITSSLTEANQTIAQIAYDLRTDLNVRSGQVLGLVEQLGDKLRQIETNANNPDGLVRLSKDLENQVETIYSTIFGFTNFASQGEIDILLDKARELERILVNENTPRYVQRAVAFGRDKWRQYIGEVGEEPPIPDDILSRLNMVCPIWPPKRVYETHTLTLVPATVNGAELTVSRLGDLVERAKGGRKTAFRCFLPGPAPDTGPAQSHWVLMTHDVLPGTRGKSYGEQCEVLSSYRTSSGLSYGVPKRLDAAVSIFMKYLASGKRLFPNNSFFGFASCTYTRCEEMFNDRYHTVIGAYARDDLFSRNGLFLNDYCEDHEFRGLAGAVVLPLPPLQPPSAPNHQLQLPRQVSPTVVSGHQPFPLTNPQPQMQTQRDPGVMAVNANYAQIVKDVLDAPSIDAFSTIPELFLNDAILKQYVCRITKKPIRYAYIIKGTEANPVFYEKAALDEWFTRSQPNKPNGWPQNLDFDRKHVTESRAVQRIIDNQLRKLKEDFSKEAGRVRIMNP